MLSDLEDTSVFFSLGMFTGNAINPCLNSTYNLIRTVVQVRKSSFNLWLTESKDMRCVKRTGNTCVQICLCWGHRTSL